MPGSVGAACMDARSAGVVPDRLLQGMMAWLDARRAEGLLSFDDAELAAEDLWGLILSAPRNQALHRPDRVPARAGHWRRAAW